MGHDFRPALADFGLPLREAIFHSRPATVVGGGPVEIGCAVEAAENRREGRVGIKYLETI